MQSVQNRGTRGFRTLQRGQGMTEYIIIVALIAIAAIAAFSFFGSTIRSQLGGIASELSGTSGADAVSQAQTNAKATVKDAKTNKKMNNYTNENN
ncbi:MAG TPA: pilus assembly protein [Rhodanobacteraceae bacterium]